eukprot:11363643-Prorocentrum_lima.AAC.1
MYYKEVRVKQPRKRKTVWKNFDHEVAPPKDVVFWLVGSTWLMSDPGEPFAMWDSGASHFLMPLT